MINFISKYPHAVEIIIEGAVAPADVSRTFQQLDSFLKICDRIDIYIEVRGPVDIAFSAIYEEFKNFSTMMRLIRQVSRVAIVADQACIRNMAQVEGMFIPGAHYEVYPLAEAETARDWLFRHTDMARAA